MSCGFETGAAEKQIIRVIDSIQRGCGTSIEVAEYTGLSVKTASSYISQLKQDGLIVVTGQCKTGRRGHAFEVFQWAWGIA